MAPPGPNRNTRPHPVTALPARLFDARYQPLEGQATKANATNAELAVKATGPSAQAAAVPVLNRELPRCLRLDLLGFGRHAGLTNPWKKTFCLSLSNGNSQRAGSSIGPGYFLNSPEARSVSRSSFKPLVALKNENVPYFSWALAGWRNGKPK
jgi:hypothetical protein